MTSTTKTCIGIGIISSLAAYALWHDGMYCGMASALTTAEKSGRTATEIIEDVANDKHFGATMVTHLVHKMRKEV